MNFCNLLFKKALQRLSIVLSTCLLFSVLSAHADVRPSVQHEIIGRQDSILLLQQCLNLPIIQKYYTRHSDGIPKQVYIMQYLVKFPDDLMVNNFGQQVLFRSRSNIRSEKAEVFLIFKTFSITGDEASVSFTLNSDYTTKTSIVEVTLQLRRSGQAWTVTQKQIHRLI